MNVAAMTSDQICTRAATGIVAMVKLAALTSPTMMISNTILSGVSARSKKNKGGTHHSAARHEPTTVMDHAVGGWRRLYSALVRSRMARMLRHTHRKASAASHATKARIGTLSDIAPT